MHIRKWQLSALGAAVVLLSTLALAAQERQVVLEKREALLKRLEPQGRKNLNVPRTDGVYLKIAAESTGAKRALEIGSSNGYSAVWIGWGLEETDGHLWTIEIDPGRAKECRENLKEAGLDKVVTSVEGDALKEIAKLEGPFDYVFIDAWKQDYDEYFRLFFPKLAEGGVIIAHNAIRQKEGMKDYLELVQNHPELDTVIVSTTMSDGMAVSYRKKKL